MSFKKPNKGSVLVFSLIVLSIVLSAALSIAVVNVSNRKSASSTSQSVQSFQVADSGVEKALKEIYKGSYTDLNAMATALATSCTSGKFSFSVLGGTSTVSFFDTNNNIIGCTSATWRDDVAKIKVEGTANGTTRVIETAVAAPTLTCGTNSKGLVFWDNTQTTKYCCYIHWTTAVYGLTGPNNYTLNCTAI
jgi:Tfp pilus assembly protein PilX